MKEKIKEVLSDETLDTVEEKVDKLSKELALLVIPKDKYNKLSERVDNLEKEKNELQSKYDDLEKKNMTAEQLKEKELQEIEKQKKELAIEKNKVKAEALFKNANIDSKQIESLINKVVNEDETKTIELANSFVEILNQKVKETEKITTTGLLNGVTKPIVSTNGNVSKDITLDQFQKMSYGEKKNLLLTDKEKYDSLVKEEYEKL